VGVGEGPALKALIWDVDGTLAETERDGHRVAFNGAFAESGLGWHWDPVLYGQLLRVTGGKERIAAWWRRVDPAAAAAPDAAARIAQLHALKTRHYEALVAAGAVSLRPGVERLLRQARAEGLTLAIATTTAPANVRSLLQHTLGAEAIGWFACIGAGDVVPHKKPAPDIYRHVLDALGLAPYEALAIEDSQPGVAAAVAAGVPVVAVRSVYSRDDDLEGALAVLDALEPADPSAGAAVTLEWLRERHARGPAVAGALASP
jgi:HAD superfamily hydrolase (TIGR01509 family)